MNMLTSKFKSTKPQRQDDDSETASLMAREDGNAPTHSSSGRDQSHQQQSRQFQHQQSRQFQQSSSGGGRGRQNSSPTQTSAKSKGGARLILLAVSLLVNVMLLMQILTWKDFTHTLEFTSAEATAARSSSPGDCADKSRRDDDNKVYGLAHIAKTAGTEINGELANHFERVCGNKGYSYDAYTTNERFRRSNANSTKGSQGDVFDNMLNPGGNGFNRGSLPQWFMREIGFEDCDYVALETQSPKDWKYVAQRWPLELHVPCRDSLDHLMSQCNIKRFKFDCEASNLPAQIKKCFRFNRGRFGDYMVKSPNITLKCFNPIPVQPYVEYMGSILQRKRVESTYVHRDTNLPRDKDSECVWKKDAEFQDHLRKIMKKLFAYYNFCGHCMGSDNELALPSNNNNNN